MQNRGSSTCSVRLRIIRNAGITEDLSIIMNSHNEDFIILIGDLQKVMLARRVNVDVVNTSVAVVMVSLRLMATSGKGQLEFTANRMQRFFFVCFWLDCFVFFFMLCSSFVSFFYFKRLEPLDSRSFPKYS